MPALISESEHLGNRSVCPSTPNEQGPANDNLAWVEIARLPIAQMQDVLLARIVGRTEAAKMDFPPAVLTRLATAISEITRNVVQHAGCPGEMRLGQVSANDRKGLRIVVADKGKGVERPERFMEEGKIGTLGSGLPGARKLVDQFEIQSAPDAGTTVTMEIWSVEATS